MRVVESFLLSAEGDPSGGEDRWVETDTVVAVFDGETDKFGGSSQTPGKRAVDSLVTATRLIDAKTNARTAVDDFTAVLSPMVQSGLQTPAAVTAVLHLPARQVWRIGDVGVGVNGVMSRITKPTDDIAAAARAALLAALLDEGATVEELQHADPGRALVLPLLRAANRFRNRKNSPYAFAAIDGRSVPESFIEVIQLPKGACEVVLASDGYVDPAPSLRESEERLKELIQRDPLRIEHPPGLKAVKVGASSFDDRCFVRVAIGPVESASSPGSW